MRSTFPEPNHAVTPLPSLPAPQSPGCPTCSQADLRTQIHGHRIASRFAGQLHYLCALAVCALAAVPMSSKSSDTAVRAPVVLFLDFTSVHSLGKTPQVCLSFQQIIPSTAHALFSIRNQVFLTLVVYTVFEGEYQFRGVKVIKASDKKCEQCRNGKEQCPYPFSSKVATMNNLVYTLSAFLLHIKSITWCVCFWKMSQWNRFHVVPQNTSKTFFLLPNMHL